MEHHQKHKITKMQKGAKSIFLIDKRKMHIFCSEKSKKGNRASGLRFPFILHQLRKEMATHKGSHLPMYQALASISGDKRLPGRTLKTKIRSTS